MSQDLPVSPIKASLDGALWLTTTLPIRLFGDPALITPCTPVSQLEITSGAAQIWANQLTNFLKLYRDRTGVGRGLAANQLGISKQIVLAWATTGPEIYINPKIVDSSGEAVYPEACISSASLVIGEVTRPWRAKISYTTLDGSRKTIEPDGIHARLLLHEIDHLDGKICSDAYNPGTMRIATGDSNEILTPELKRIS
jgi:peptide deformylase